MTAQRNKSGARASNALGEKRPSRTIEVVISPLGCVDADLVTPIEGFINAAERR
jgi:hypothetical protein